MAALGDERDPYELRPEDVEEPLIVLVSLVQMGGMFGGVAHVLNLLLPAVPVWLRVLLLLGLTQLLLLGRAAAGIYGLFATLRPS